jgi:hypothetical protein
MCIFYFCCPSVLFLFSMSNIWTPRCFYWFIVTWYGRSVTSCFLPVPACTCTLLLISDQSDLTIHICLLRSFLLIYLMALTKLFDCDQEQCPKVQIWNSDYLTANALMLLNPYSSVWFCDGFIESILFPAVDPAVSWKYLFWICNSKILFLDL